MQGYREVQAVVLRTRDQGEADRRVSLLTPSGRIEVKAPGTRRMKSRLGGILQPPTFASVTIYEKGRGRTVTGAEPIESFAGVHDDLRRLAAAQVLLEICDVTSGEEDALSPFLSLVQGLRAVAREDDTGWALLRAELGLLTAYGWGLQLDRCMDCGEDLRPSLHYQVELGGFTCGRCQHMGVSVSGQALHALASAQAGDGPGGDVSAARGLLHLTWAARLERRLESARFAEEVLGT